MQYYSEKTKKIYKTEDDLISAEKDYDNKSVEIEKLKEARGAAAKEVEIAFKKVEEDREIANKLLNEFIHTYGSYHHTYYSAVPTTRSSNIFDVFSDLFDWPKFL